MSRPVFACAASALALATAWAAPAMSAARQPDPTTVATLGETIEGALEEGDWQDGDGYLNDAYRFRARAGTRVEAVMRSDDFDTYLVAGRYGPDGTWEEIGRDDDGLGEGLNSRLRFVAPEDGEYVVRARSFGGSSTGAYQLSLTDRGPAPESPAPGSLAVGATVTGALEPGDAETEDEVRYDAYRFRAGEGQRLQITARSEAFDTVVEVGREDAYGQWEQFAYDDDGLGEGLNSRLNFTPEEGGDYILRLRAFGEAGTGDYQLSLVDRGPLPPPPPPTPLSLGEAVQGELTEEDPITEGEDYLGELAFDQYVVRARRGQRLGVSMDAEDFDPLVRIGRLDAGGGFEELASNDDGLGAGLNSRLLFTPERDGDYVVRATAFSQGLGAYDLSVVDLGREPRAVPLRPGRTIDASLEDGDGITFGGARYDVYRFRARAGERFSIAASSQDFDTVIDVLQSDGDGGYGIVASDDDGAGGETTDSRLTFRPNEDGEYFVWVKAFDPEGRGDYRITLTDLGPEPEPRPIAVGATVQGELIPTDSVAGDASYYDAYRFSARAGQRLRIVMRSGDFDTFLLLGREGEYGLQGLAEDDDGLGEGTDSRINFTVVEDGDYVVWANSYAPGELGAYALEIADLGPVPEPGSIVVGTTLRGELGGDDPMDANGAYYDAYRFRAREGDRLRMTMTSNAFDTFIEFGRAGEGGAFEQIDSDDDGLSDLNSRLDVLIPSTGEYLIRARSYGAGETGEYVMTLEPAPAEAEAPAAAEAGAPPSADGEAGAAD